MKGRLVGTEIQGNTLELWYESPTGDSTDALIHRLPCIDVRQAVALERVHRHTWGLSDADRSHQLEVALEESLKA